MVIVALSWTVRPAFAWIVAVPSWPAIGHLVSVDFPARALGGQ